MCRDRKVTLGGGAEVGDSNGAEKEGGTIGSVQQSSSFPYIC